MNFRSGNRTAVILLLLVSLFGERSLAQTSNYRTMGITDVIGAADAFLQRGEYEKAIIPLKEAIARSSREENPQIIEMVQGCRFYLARAYLKIGETESSVEYFEEYLSGEPCPKEREALRLLSSIYYDNSQWLQLEEVTERLLTIKQLPRKDVLTGNLLLGQALFRQDKWEEAIEPLTIAAEMADEEKVQQVMHIMIVRSLVKLERFDDLYIWIPKLYRTDARYDITLNIALMNAGKDRFVSRDYLNALALYRMVLDRDKLLAFQNKNIAALTAELEQAQQTGTTEERETAMMKAIDVIKDSVKTLQELPAYEDEVDFRIGQIYSEVKRYWEGIALFEQLYRENPESETGLAGLYKAVMGYYDLELAARAEEHILRYLNNATDRRHARPFISMMMRDNLQKKDYTKVMSLVGHMDRLEAPDKGERLLQSSLHYMLAFGYFLKPENDYQRAADQFGIVLETYSESEIVPDATYYRGLAYVFMKEYQSALDYFLTYQEQYPEGEHIADSLFREGVCLLGLEKTAESEAVFTRFIEIYPDSELISEAYSMRADIRALNGLIDEAIADYDMAIEKAKTVTQASYAVFNAAKVYKSKYRYDDIIVLMNRYMEQFGDKADQALAVFWIGESQIMLGQIQEAIAGYKAAVRKFGSDTKQEGVDKIITKLVEIYELDLTEEQQKLFVADFSEERTAAGSDKVMELRLDALLARIGGEEASLILGGKLIKKQKDLGVTSPVSLALMCDAVVAGIGQQRADEIQKYFISTFDDSDLVWHAHRVKLVQLLAAGEEEAALEVIKESQSRFGVDPYMGWAQIAKADTLYKLGRYEEAAKEYKDVHGVAEWRGPLFASAMYGLGRCNQAQKSYDKAFAYYQRTYLLYKGYDEGRWAADAYLASAKCLRLMEDDIQAVDTLKAMLDDPYVNTLPQAETARKLLKNKEDA